tara:strand:+ start:1364 stop:2359 length:996 start_codon:yes stop_codon:yes gene_type:complete
MNDKLKKLKEGIAKIEKNYGKGTVINLTGEIEKVPAISSGSLTLDLALGVGGFPRGRIVELYGWESSGKTTLALHTLAEAQKSSEDSMVAFIDMEHAIDTEYAQNLGLDTSKDRFKLFQPDSGEDALNILEDLVEMGIFEAIVIDSVAALVPKAELAGETGDSKMGLQARMMGQSLRKISPKVSKSESKTLVIFINQIREKLGVLFGSPETTAGGNALKFYASVRCKVTKSTQIKDDGAASGNKTRVKVEKNKVAPPFKVAEFDIMYGTGISRVGEIIDLGVDLEIIKKSGSWFSYGETKLGQGKESVKELLEENPDLTEELENKIKEALG